MNETTQVLDLFDVADELRSLGWEVFTIAPRGIDDPIPGYLWAATHNDDNVDFRIRLDDDATGFISTVSGGGYSKSIPFTAQTLATFAVLAKHGIATAVAS